MHPIHRRLFAAFLDLAQSQVLVFNGQSLTFSSLLKQAQTYAAGLLHRGATPGERVAVLLEPSPESIVALLGHHLAGLIHVPINHRYGENEIGHILTDSEASIWVSASQDLERLPPNSSEHLRLCVRVGTATPSTPEVLPAFSTIEFDTKSPTLGGLPGLSDLPDPESTALIIYTSGTTGLAKGVELSYRAIEANIGALTQQWGFSPDDRLSLSLPLFHVHGLCIGVYGSFLRGHTLLLHPRFDPTETIDDFAKRGATVFMGVPTMYARLLAQLEQAPESSLAFAPARLFTSGSAPLSVEHATQFETATGHQILERYGMTETLLTLSNPLNGERRAGYVGHPVGDTEVKIIDDAGHLVKLANTFGELYVRGSSLFSGYWKNPESTKSSIQDGWFRTGDIVERSSDGYIRIAGRASTDIIKSGGFKISSREIEDVLLNHPLVLEVAVIGRPCSHWGERIVAAAVFAATPSPASDLLGQLQTLCASRIADFKKPRGLILLSALPRNALGKIQKHRLREIPLDAGES